MSEWLENLTADDLPDVYREMAVLIGVEATLKLAAHYRKQSVYFKSLNELIASKKSEYIIANFTGANYDKLARETGYSTRWVREILKDRNKESQSDLFNSSASLLEGILNFRRFP